MKACTFLLVLASSSLARAQFYAPQTDFHDPSQRLFPVEAARVIAWQQRDAERLIADVGFALEPVSDGKVLWKITWRGADGATLREATVRYAEAELLDGPAWYRRVWKQLGGAGAKEPAKGDIAAACWEGAKAAGLSRMEGISAAKKLAVKPITSAADAAQLAGCLAQAALPGVSTATMLDSLLLARASAWLCLAEEMAGQELPDVWPPLLLLAGREGVARELWAKPGALRDHAAPLIRMWDTLITQPSALVALVGAVQPENREYAAPIFCAYGGVEPAYRDMWIEVLGDLWPADVRKRLHDYGPTITHGSRNRVPAEDLAAQSIRAVLDQLDDMAGPPGDVDKVRALAGKALAAQSKTDVPAPSPELRELLNRAAAESTGPLIPTAVAPRRDVLNFAWEMAGQQIAALVGRLVTTGGSQPRGKELGAAWIGAITGWDAFENRIKTGQEPLADSTRYEFLTSQEISQRLAEVPPLAWREARDLPSVYLRRRWLVDPHRGVQFSDDHEGDPKTVAALIRRALAEGGQWSLDALAIRERYPAYRLRAVEVPAAGVLAFRGAQGNYDDLLDLLGLREEIARTCPLSIGSAVTLIHQKFADGREPLAHARALERLHWESGVAFAVDDVILAYTAANAGAEARRFFSEAVSAVPNRYMNEITLPGMALAVALLDGDEAGAEALLNESPGLQHYGSGLELALMRGDVLAADKAIATYVEHFPKSWGAGPLRRLQNWLPLLPMLSDRAHPEHRRAVESFPHGRNLLLGQWLLLTRARLPEDEAIRFLEGSRDTTGARSGTSADLLGATLLVEAVKKDAAIFSQRVARFDSNGTRENEVLMAWLHARLHEVAPAPGQPDLHGGGAGWLFPRLREAVALKQ